MFCYVFWWAKNKILPSRHQNNKKISQWSQYHSTIFQLLLWRALWKVNLVIAIEQATLLADIISSQLNLPAWDMPHDEVDCCNSWYGRTCIGPKITHTHLKIRNIGRIFYIRGILAYINTWVWISKSSVCLVIYSHGVRVSNIEGNRFQQLP